MTAKPSDTDKALDAIFKVEDYKLDGTIGLRFKGRQASVWINRKDWESMKTAIKRLMAEDGQGGKRAMLLGRLNELKIFDEYDDKTSCLGDTALRYITKRYEVLKAELQLLDGGTEREG